MPRSKPNTITYRDMFLRYPYKCKTLDPNSKTVELPYFPKSEIVCDHPYSVTYKEYKAILISYFEKVLHLLRTGGTYKLYSRLGHISVFRFECPTPDMTLMRERGKELRTSRHHLNNQSFGISWKKRSRVSGHFKYYKYWIVKVGREPWARMFRAYFEENMNRMFLISKR